MGVLAAEVTMETALSEITTLVTTGMGIITGNSVLMVMFCGGLLGIAFRVIRQAKRASK